MRKKGYYFLLLLRRPQSQQILYLHPFSSQPATLLLQLLQLVILTAVLLHLLPLFFLLTATLLSLLQHSFTLTAALLLLLLFLLKRLFLLTAALQFSCRPNLPPLLPFLLHSCPRHRHAHPRQQLRTLLLTTPGDAVALALHMPTGKFRQRFLR